MKIIKFILCIVACDMIGTTMTPEADLEIIERIGICIAGCLMLWRCGRPNAA